MYPVDLEGFSPKMSRPCFIKWLKSKHEVPEKDCTVLEGKQNCQMIE